MTGAAGMRVLPGTPETVGSNPLTDAGIGFDQLLAQDTGLLRVKGSPKAKVVMAGPQAYPGY